MHSHEVNLVKLSGEKLDDLRLEAMELSKNHLEALETQLKRQVEEHQRLTAVEEPKPVVKKEDAGDVGEDVLKYLAKNKRNR